MAMVLSECATAPGVIIECRAAGVVLLEQDSKKGSRERNDRVIAVPLHAATEDAYAAHGQLPSELTKQLESFFLSAAAEHS